MNNNTNIETIETFLSALPHHCKTQEELKSAINTLVQNGYSLHHTSVIVGYVSRKTWARIELYEGRFGKGFKILEPRYDTSRFVYCAYYVKED